MIVILIFIICFLVLKFPQKRGIVLQNSSNYASGKNFRRWCTAPMKDLSCFCVFGASNFSNALVLLLSGLSPVSVIANPNHFILCLATSHFFKEIRLWAEVKSNWTTSKNRVWWQEVILLGWLSPLSKEMDMQSAKTALSTEAQKTCLKISRKNR